MATTNRIATQTLTLGQTAVSSAFTPSAEPLTLLLTASEVVASQVRLIVYGALGQVLGSLTVNGSNTQKVILFGFDGAVSIAVSCILGSAIVRVDDVTGADALSGQLQTADLADAAITNAKLGAGAVTITKADLRTGSKTLGADGVDSTGGDAQVTLTGAVIGMRVRIIFGQVKANTGAHTYLFPTIGTHFESVITVTDKIIQKQAAGDIHLNTYLFILDPAAA